MNEKKQISKFLNKHFLNFGGYEEEDFLYTNGIYKNAIFYSMLFMPEFIEINNSILLKKNPIGKEITQRFEMALKDPKNHLSYLEENWNTIDIREELLETDEILLDEEKILAERIRNAWDGWLRIKYPNRKFVVKVKEKTEEKGYIVCFYEKRI